MRACACAGSALCASLAKPHSHLPASVHPAFVPPLPLLHVFIMAQKAAAKKGAKGADLVTLSASVVPLNEFSLAGDSGWRGLDEVHR